MRKLLLQLDSSRLPSVFDRVVAYDGGADEVMSYGGIVEADARDLMHGCIFTRGPKDLKDTATFIGGADMGAGGRAPPPGPPGILSPLPRPPPPGSKRSHNKPAAAGGGRGPGPGDTSRARRPLLRPGRAAG